MSFWGYFSRTSGTRKSNKVAAFVEWHITEPTNVLHQDTTASPSPKVSLLGAAARSAWCRHEQGHPSVDTRGKSDRNITLTTKLPAATSAYRTTVRRRLQHHVPLSHGIRVSAGDVLDIYRLNSKLWRLPWDGLIVAFSGATTPTFFSFYETPLNKRQLLPRKLVWARGSRDFHHIYGPTT